MPGAAIDAIQAHSYANATAELNLRPIRLNDFGALFLYPLLEELIKPFPLMILARKKRIAFFLDSGLDKQVKLLLDIKDGHLGETPTGEFLMGIKESFTPEVFFDVLCFVQLNIELTVAAKARFMLKEAGLDAPIPEQQKQDILSQYQEYKTLEKRLGQSAKMAIAPVVKFYPADRMALGELNVNVAMVNKRRVT